MDENKIYQLNNNTKKIGEPKMQSQDTVLQEQIIASMRTIFDPEISMNIYDLGLIYELNVNECLEVFIKMTLTSPACPVAGVLPGQVEAAVKGVQGVRDAHVKLVWDPPWSPDHMSDEARLTMDLF